MRSPYYRIPDAPVVSSGMRAPVFIIRDKSELSREEYFILEKHSQDLFHMLLREIILMHSLSEIPPELSEKAKRILAEYIDTKALLGR